MPLAFDTDFKAICFGQNQEFCVAVVTVDGFVGDMLQEEFFAVCLWVRFPLAIHFNLKAFCFEA